MWATKDMMSACVSNYLSDCKERMDSLVDDSNGDDDGTRGGGAAGGEEDGAGEAEEAEEADDLETNGLNSADGTLKEMQATGPMFLTRQCLFDLGTDGVRERMYVYEAAGTYCRVPMHLKAIMRIHPCPPLPSPPPQLSMEDDATQSADGGGTGGAEGSRGGGKSGRGKETVLSWIMMGSHCLSLGAQGVVEDDMALGDAVALKNYELSVMLHANGTLDESGAIVPHPCPGGGGGGGGGCNGGGQPPRTDSLRLVAVPPPSSVIVGGGTVRGEVPVPFNVVNPAAFADPCTGAWSAERGIPYLHDPLKASHLQMPWEEGRTLPGIDEDAFRTYRGGGMDTANDTTPQQDPEEKKRRKELRRKMRRSTLPPPSLLANTPVSTAPESMGPVGPCFLHVGEGAAQPGSCQACWWDEKLAEFAVRKANELNRTGIVACAAAASDRCALLALLGQGSSDVYK